jgi:hypothetical protein
MGWKGTLRAMEAAQRRQQRDAQKRQRELERQNKEQAKLSAIEQARLEVETHENKLEVLLSVHREQGEIWDWIAIVASLPPPYPQKNSNHELKTKQLMLVSTSRQNEGKKAAIEQARLQDEQAFQEAIQTYVKEKAEQEKMKGLAFRILAHEHKAYIEALVEFSPLREISDLGSLLHFTVHSATLIECEMKVNSTQTIPTEVKTLTSSGKLSVKTMPMGRFHEIYQDYVCGCMLRVAREVFAMLPVETVLVTALADLLDARTGHTAEQPVLSAAMPRTVNASVPFEFDIHAVIKTKNAAAFEYKFHRQFLENRWNKKNLHKEFFRVSLEEIHQEVEKLKQQGEGCELEWRKTEAGRIAEWQESRDIENDSQRKDKWLKLEQASADERWVKRERRFARRGGGDALMLSVSDGLETDADDVGA